MIILNSRLAPNWGLQQISTCTKINWWYRYSSCHDKFLQNQSRYSTFWSIIRAGWWSKWAHKWLLTHNSHQENNSTQRAQTHKQNISISFLVSYGKRFYKAMIQMAHWKWSLFGSFLAPTLGINNFSIEYHLEKKTI